MRRHRPPSQVFNQQTYGNPQEACYSTATAPTSAPGREASNNCIKFTTPAICHNSTMDDKTPLTNQDSKSRESSSSRPSTAGTSSNTPPTARSMVPVTMRTGFQPAVTDKKHMAIKVKSMLRQGEKCADDMAQVINAIAMRLAEDRSKLGDHTLAVEIEQFLVISGIQLYLTGDMVVSLEYWASCHWAEDNFWILKEELEDRLTVVRRLRELHEKVKVDLDPPWNAKQRQLMVNAIRICTGFDDFDPDSAEEEVLVSGSNT